MVGIYTSYKTGATRATSTASASKTKATSTTSSTNGVKSTKKTTTIKSKTQLDEVVLQTKTPTTTGTAKSSSTAGSSKTTTTTSTAKTTSAKTTSSAKTPTTTGTAKSSSTAGSSKTTTTTSTAKTIFAKTTSFAQTPTTTGTAKSSSTAGSSKTTSFGSLTVATKEKITTTRTTKTSSTAGTSKTSNLTGSTASSSSVVDSLNKIDENRINNLEKQLKNDEELAKAIKYQNDGSAMDTYSESKQFISDTISELIGEKGYTINDIVVAGGADYLNDISKSLSGYNVSDFKIDKKNITPDLINIISSAYENASSEEKQSYGLLSELYQQAKDYIVSQASNPALYTAYAQQMGNIDGQFDNDKQMSLSEMLQNVDKFNQILKTDPNFYDDYVTTSKSKDGSIIYNISDAQRAQIITDENALLKENRNIVEDSDYTMTNPNALTKNFDDSFWDKFGKSVATMDFVADGGWKEYNQLNKEYQEYQKLCNQLNSQGSVVYNGKTYNANNAKDFIESINKKVEEIQNQKDKIEQTESFNAAVAATAGELGWEATKFALGFSSAGLTTIVTTAADGAITFHDSLAEGNDITDALIDASLNIGGNIIGGKVMDSMGNYLFETSSVPNIAKQDKQIFKDWLLGNGFDIPTETVDVIFSKISFDGANNIQSDIEEIGGKIVDTIENDLDKNILQKYRKI